MRKRRNAALDADRFSAYEAGRRVEGRPVNRLLFRFCALESAYTAGAEVFRETSTRGTSPAVWRDAGGV